MGYRGLIEVWGEGMKNNETVTCHPLGYERCICKVADTPFYIQGDEVCTPNQIYPHPGQFKKGPQLMHSGDVYGHFLSQP